jgi:chaperonin GroEL
LNVFRKAIMAPLRQIVGNSGRDTAEIELNIENCGPNFGFDVKNGEYGNMMTMGIIDPAKVTKNALVSATSVAVTLLGTNAIVTNESSK